MRDFEEGQVQERGGREPLAFQEDCECFPLSLIAKGSPDIIPSSLACTCLTRSQIRRGGLDARTMPPRTSLNTVSAARLRKVSSRATPAKEGSSSTTRC